MSENQSGTKVVKFDDVVKQVEKVTAILDKPGAQLDPEQLMRDLREYAPSMIGASGESVTVQVRNGDQYWTAELESIVRAHIETFRRGDGASHRLTVIRVDDEATTGSAG